MVKAALHMPFAVPIVKLAYTADGGARRHISIYPTLQFLYSHHVCPEYVTPAVRQLLASFKEVCDPQEHCRRFLEATKHLEESDALDAGAPSEAVDGHTSAGTAGPDGQQAAGPAGEGAGAAGAAGAAGGAGGAALGLEVLINHVRVAPQYSLAALR